MYANHCFFCKFFSQHKSELTDQIRPIFFIVDEQPSTSQLLSDQSRKTPWSDQETRLLLKIWGEDRIQLSLKGSMKNRHVYEYISTKMSDYGYIRNSEQCYTRIKRLKSGFQHEKLVNF